MILNSNILFIHIPRTGGTTFERINGFISNGEKHKKGIPELLFGVYNNKTMTHYTLSEAHEHIKTFLNKNPKDFYTVSIIRNPYVRFFSLFNYNGGFKTWGNINKFIEDKKPLQEKYFFRPQHEFICDNNGNIQCDFVIRFEHYMRDLKNLKKIVNRKMDNITFFTERQQRKEKQIIKRFKNKKAILNKINKIYKNDFKYLGYEML